MYNIQITRRYTMTSNRNFVAKYAKTSGAGTHVQKTGKLAPRAKVKQRFIKELKEYNGR